MEIGENNSKVRVLIIAAVVVVVAVLIIFAAARKEQDFSVKYAGYDLSGASTGRTNTYSRYMEKYVNAPIGQRDISINIFSWASAQGTSIVNNFENEQRVVRTEEVSFVEYTVNVERAGLYFIKMDYFPVASRGIAIERALSVNDEIPFLGADRLSFLRVWGDSGSSRFDNQGNEIRASQTEKPRWESAWFRDPLGYVTEPYSFYFKQGANKIRLTGVNEPLVIRSLTIKAPVKTQSYKDYISGIDLDKYKNNRSNYSLKIQGEKSTRRSDPSLYPIYDRSSGATEPPSVARIRLNMIGGQSWRVAGQWIEWEFEAPEKGLYRISIKGRQNYNRGYVSNRTVMINGEIPVQELSSVPFNYSNKWSLNTLGDKNGYFLFPLEAGVNTIRVQATMGGMGEMLNVMEESVFRLNSIYRKILVLTGPEPDIYRDYRVDVVYPEVITAMELESRICLNWWTI